MTEYENVTHRPVQATRSTLLVPRKIYQKCVVGSPYIKIRNLPISFYLKRLLLDKHLEKRIGILRSTSWKKKYQSMGQDLVRVNFYPDSSDWGSLSALSNSTGFSRCYIFVFLMLIDLGLDNQEHGGTPPKFSPAIQRHYIKCQIEVELITKKLLRRLLL